MKNIFIIFALIVFTILLSGCILKEKWQGVYYPDGCLVCEDDYIFSPVYDTKADCLDWAVSKKISRNNNNDLYECGKNCDWKDGLMICEETVDN